MAELTTKQKEIVDELTQKFVAINGEKPNDTFNIININALRNDINEIETMKKELDAYNVAMKKAHNLMISELAVKLNEDFEKANFPIFAKINELSTLGEGNDIEIQYEDLKNVRTSEFHGDIVRMHVSSRSERVDYGATFIGYKLLGYRFHIAYNSSMKSTDTYFNTPQEFFGDTIVQSKIIRLIRISEEYKKTGKRPRI